MKGITEKEREEGDRGRRREGGRERKRGIMGKAFRTLHTIYLLFFVFLLVFISHSCNMSTKASIRFPA